MQNKTVAPDSPEQVNQESPTKSAAITVSNKALTLNAIQSALLKISANLDTPEMLAAFINAALCGYGFPEQFTAKLSSLQQAYQLNVGNDAVKNILEEAIRQYMKTEGIVVIKTLLQQNNIVPQFWQSALVRYLAQSLKITIDKNYVVQASVCHGKINWRIIDDQGMVMYDRTHAKTGQPYQFTPEQSWIMPWAMFQSMKASGKRYSNYPIGREHFVSQFLPHLQFNAGLVWDELRRQNIISAKFKLTDNWRLFSGDHLNIAPNIRGLITFETIVTVLNAFGRVTQAEILPVESHFKIYRMDRSPKQAYSTGLIENFTPTSSELCTKLWDVSLKCDLTAHRNTTEEEKLYGEKLNYDHIMAKQDLKPEALAAINHLQNVIQGYEMELQQLQNQLQITQAKLQANAPVSASTRGAIAQSQHNAPEVQNLLLQIRNKEECIALNNHFINAFSAERNAKDGGFWWTVAIPFELHKRGKTYLKTVKTLPGEMPLMRDINWYLDMLEKQPEEFNLTHTDILYALGAFRLLYRKQATEHAEIPNAKKHVGYTPGLFFIRDKTANFALVDTFFNQRIKRYIDQREGFEGHKKLDPKQLPFK